MAAVKQSDLGNVRDEVMEKLVLQINTTKTKVVMNENMLREP